MILDSSAIVAIALQEIGYEKLLDAVSNANTIAVGAPTLVEATIVLSARLQRDARPLVSRLRDEAGWDVIAFDEAHVSAALDAWLRFGRGRHPARLNYGDCLAYAVARLARRPLLCLGDDFAQTDLEVVAI